MRRQHVTAFALLATLLVAGCGSGEPASMPRQQVHDDVDGMIRGAMASVGKQLRLTRTGDRTLACADMSKNATGALRLSVQYQASPASPGQLPGYFDRFKSWLSEQDADNVSDARPAAFNLSADVDDTNLSLSTAGSDRLLVTGHSTCFRPR